MPPERSLGTHRYFTRSKIQCYRGAGILPYAIHENKVVFLLGQELRRVGFRSILTYCWSDFGGSREAADNDDFIATAAREFSEETFGLFVGSDMNDETVKLSYEHFVKIIQNNEGIYTFDNNGYKMILVPATYIDPFFLKVAVQSKHLKSSHEKRDLAWFNATQILLSLNRYKKKPVQNQQEPKSGWKPFKVFPTNVWRSFEYIEETMQLFPRFRYTLLGQITEFISAIKEIESKHRVPHTFIPDLETIHPCVSAAIEANKTE